MFKQQQKNQAVSRQRGEKREEPQTNRMASFGIRVVSNWIDDRKANNTSQSKRQHGKSPNTNPQPQPQHSQQPSKSASMRGIQVVSSRPSSNEKPSQNPSSRSDSKQKQSKQMKSQTNISEFDSADNTSKDPSFEKQSPSQQEDYQVLLVKAERRFKERMEQQSKAYEAEINSLKDIIECNDDRIDNLITSLNMLVEEGGKKDRFGRLQARINSNKKYAEQCYQYTVARCTDNQTILRHLSDSIHNCCVQNIEIQNKMQYIQRIIVDIFTVQRALVYQQQANFHNEIKRMELMLTSLEEKLNQLGEFELKLSLEEMKYANFKEHLRQLKASIHAKSQTQIQKGRHFEDKDYGWINKEELAIKMEALQLKITQLETAKTTLEEQIKTKQENSQQAIWQLSALLNKQERELQKAQKENSSLLSYNKQIENKLIESRCRESSMQVYMQNHLKSLQASLNNEETLRVSQENEVFRQKYEELFRHNQYLEDINCRNNLELINNRTLIEDLHGKLKTQQAFYEEITSLKKEILTLKEEAEAMRKKLGESSRKIEEKDNEIFSKSLEIQRVTVQFMTLKNEVAQINQALEEMSSQLKSAKDENQSLLAEKNRLNNQLQAIQKELEEEELYSHHLEQQNQKLQNKLKEYTRSFEEQSAMFKTTIDKLKKQREERRPTEAKTDRTFSSNPSLQTKTSSPPSSSITRAQQEKLLRLKKAIDAAGYKKPVPCQIDGTGYLKHHEVGTYIVDAQENLFDLTTQQQHLAIRTNLIHLFQ